MTNTYRQLTLDQRYQIQSDKAAGFSAGETADRIGCHRSTIYRELSRCPGSDYGARRAQKASDARRKCAYKRTKFTNPKTRTYMDASLSSREIRLLIVAAAEPNRKGSADIYSGSLSAHSGAGPG